jgi:hypothetical protein
MSHRYTILILTPVLAISLMLLGLGGAAAWTVHRVNKDVSDLLHEHVVCTLASEMLVAGMNDMYGELSRFIDTSDASHLLTAHQFSLENEQQLLALNQIATTTTAQQSIDQLTGSQRRMTSAIAAAQRRAAESQAAESQAVESQAVEGQAAAGLSEHVATLLEQRPAMLAPARELLEYNRKAAER